MTLFRRPGSQQRHSQTSSARKRTTGLRSKPRLELLEDRLAPAAITVTTTADDLTPNDGSVSLREAITAINNGSSLGDPDIIAQNPGTFGVNGTINFNISASQTVQTINVGSTGLGALPALLARITINGYTEPGASPNTLANGDNARILIELNGANAGPNADGLLIGTTGAGSMIEGLAINRFSLNGLEAQGGGDTIAGNFVGTNPAGSAAEPNQNDGIRISNSSNSTIGGTTPNARNVVSGNSVDGIHIVGSTGAPATGNLIRGNFVGVNAAGTGSVGLRPSGITSALIGTVAGNALAGIEISGGTANTIGGFIAASANVVGFNTDGIALDDGAQGNLIQGNFSGVGADGVTPVGNLLHGIVVRSDDNLSPPLGPGQANEPATSGNIIGLNPGAAFSGLGNLIEFNGAAGVALFGSPPPNNATPLQNSGNSILGNSISQNGLNNPAAIGIDLSNQFVYPKDDGATPGNAPHGAANDPNNFQSFPTLTAVTPSGSSTTIGGHLIQAASPNTSFRIEFFANDFNMSGGHYEGQNFLGATNVTTNAAGQASFLVTLNVPVAVGRFLTATATNLTPDPSSQAGAVNVFNTSELSPALFVGNANQAFVFKVFRDLLGRLPDPGGLAAFAQLMNQGFSPTQVVQTIEGSLEYRAREVQNLYTRLLHRSADAGGLIAFANMLGAGGTVAQVEVGLLASGEYFANRGGGTDAGFVSALYLDLLGRSADASAQSWVNALNSQSLTRAQVAADILNSGEGLRDLVQGFYTEFLFRSASSSEVTVWVHALQNGVSQEAALAAILGSTESFHNPGF
jgi:CSLREA domain-containing protein